MYTETVKYLAFSISYKLNMKMIEILLYLNKLYVKTLSPVDDVHSDHLEDAVYSW